jgi:hypothetical protein
VSQYNRWFQLNIQSQNGLKTLSAAPEPLKVPITRLACGLKPGYGSAVGDQNDLTFVAVV